MEKFNKDDFDEFYDSRQDDFVPPSAQIDEEIAAESVKEILPEEPTPYYPSYTRPKARLGLGAVWLMTLFTIIVSAAVSFCVAIYVFNYKPEILPFIKSDKITSLEQISNTNADQLSVVDIAKKVGPAVVGVDVLYSTTNAFGKQVEGYGSGSGIIIKDNGYIVTNYHVIENAKAVKVAMNTGEEYEAKIIGVDAVTDLAVIKIEANNLPTAEIGMSSELEVGEIAVAIGNPLGIDFAGTVTVGFISALNREMTVEGTNYTLIQTDAAINSGNSGGGLINSYGQIIGINTVKVNSAEGMGFAIPIDNAKPVIDDLINYGYVKGRPAAGFSSVRDVTEDLAKLYDMPVGIYVSYVEPSGGADNAGMRVRDIITATDGEKTLTLNSFKKVVEKHKAGDTIKIVVQRQENGVWKPYELTVTLAEAKHNQ